MQVLGAAVLAIRNAFGGNAVIGLHLVVAVAAATPRSLIWPS
jgi:hypothetical protein